MLSHYEVIVSGLGAALAALIYISRQVRKLGKFFDLLARLPKEHEHLMETTATNTEAIKTILERIDTDNPPVRH